MVGQEDSVFNKAGGQVNDIFADEEQRTTIIVLLMVTQCLFGDRVN